MARSMGLNKINRCAFILGNVFPDLNPLTYLIRSGSNRLGGHNFSSRKAFIQSMATARCRGPLSWFTAGEKLHYLADAFTRPHNHQFECSSRKHVSYERTLHKYFSRRLPHKFHLSNIPDLQDFPGWLKKIHARYIKSSPGIALDCQYILYTYAAACKMLCSKHPPASSATGIFQNFCQRT